MNIRTSLGTAAGVVLAASISSAAIVKVALQGVLVRSLDQSCVSFQGDDGVFYVLSSLGGFVAGDRVHVQGSYNTQMASICSGNGGPFISVTAVSPAFAGIGTLIRVGNQTRLQAPDGRVFQVQNLGGFAAGAQVYAEGIVTTNVSPPRISNNVIGRPFSGFGRLTNTTAGTLRFRSDAGVNYSLDRIGSNPYALVGDYVFVEGIAGNPSGGITPLSSVTSRPAYSEMGEVVSAPWGAGFVADTEIFGATYSAAGLSSFQIGNKVYVRGRGADDYDYQEVKGNNDLRQSVVSTRYVGYGTLNSITKTVVDDVSGVLINLEGTGNPSWNPNGSYVYVAGQISSTGPGTVTLSHNQIRQGFLLEGFIVNGFGCSPIIAFDSGGYLFPRNLGPYQVGDHVQVKGGFTFAVPCADVGGLVDNSIIETAVPECPDCQ